MSNEDIEFDKKIIQFTKKPAKHGDYYIFHIPNSFIKEGLIDPHKEYTVYLKEVKWRLLLVYLSDMIA